MPSKLLRAFVVAAALLVPCSLLAQSTTVVSGTIVDPNGVPWGGASITANLSASATVTVTNQNQCISAGLGNQPCQMPVQGTWGPAIADATGHFTMSLFSNTAMMPNTVQYIFSVIAVPVLPPWGTGPQAFTDTLTITGATQDVSTSFNALAKALTQATGSSSISSCTTAGGVLYQNGTNNKATCGPLFVWDTSNNLIELNGSTSGQAEIGVNPVAGTPNKAYLPTTTATPGQFLSSDGGNPQNLSWAFAQPAINTITVSPTCPTGLSTCYQINDDLRFDINASYTSGSNQITTSSAAPAFVSATDNTKQIFAAGNCSTINDINCKYDCPQGTLTVVSAHVATTGGGNCTENSGATTNTNNAVWCHDDGTTVHNALQAALASSGTSGSLQLNSPSYLVLPGGGFCTGSNALVATQAQASRTWPLDIVGNNTVIVPLPKIPGNTQGGSYPAKYGYVVADSYENGVVGQLGTTDVWKDFTIWCGGTDVPDSSATFSNGISVVYMGGFFGHLENVIVNGCVWNRPLANVTYGISVIGGTMTNSGAGAAGNFSCFLAPASTSVPATMFGGSCGSSQYNSLTISNNGGGGFSGTAVATYGILIVPPNGPGAAKQSYGVYNAATGNTWHDYGSVLEGVYNDAGGTTYLDGSTVKGTGTMAAVDLAGGNILFHNVSFNSGLNMSAGTMSFLGGNGVVNGTGSLFPFPLGYALTGGNFVFYNYVAGNCTGSPVASNSTFGLYGTGANVTALPCAATIGLGIPQQKAGTAALLQCHSTAVGVSGDSCVALLNGSAFGTSITCSMNGVTSCTDTLHTGSFNVNDRISCEVVTGNATTLANPSCLIGTDF